MLRAIVKLVCSQRLSSLRGAVVHEFVAFTLRHPIRSGSLAGRGSGLMPSLAAVVGALNDLPEPSTRLRCVDGIGICWRALQVIELPAREVRTAYVPFRTSAVRGK